LLLRAFRGTPPTLVMAVAALLGGSFALDAASAGDDAAAPRWLTPGDDALVASLAAACHGEHRRAWCNPPYGKVAGGAGGAGLEAGVATASEKDSTEGEDERGPLPVRRRRPRPAAEGPHRRAARRGGG
jgi:hypothetical protein